MFLQLRDSLLVPSAFELLADTACVDADDGLCCMMTMMDQATRYVAIRIMKDEQSVTLVKRLERGWIKHFGTPRYLRIDEGKGFAATRLRDWCSEHGIMLEIAPARQDRAEAPSGAQGGEALHCRQGPKH